MSKITSKFTCTLALLCTAAAAHGQTSAPLLDVEWINGGPSVSRELWAAASAAPTIWWRVMTAGMVFSDGGLNIGPSGSHNCKRQSDARLYRCDKVAGGPTGDYSYAIRLTQTATVAKSPPTLPDGWIQNE